MTNYRTTIPLLPLLAKHGESGLQDGDQLPKSLREEVRTLIKSNPHFPGRFSLALESPKEGGVQTVGEFRELREYAAANRIELGL